MKIAGDYMPKSLYNATVIPGIVKLISDKYSINDEQALDSFYKSETAKALNDPETGLFGQSSLYIFSLYQKEIDQQ